MSPLAVTVPFTEPSGVFLVLFVVVLVMPRLAEKLRLPGLVGLTLGGLVIGPFGLQLVEREGTVALLGGAGILFLMFEAGLELDRDTLHEQRGRTAIFGTLTFVAPLAAGLLVHLWLGYSFTAALLLASCWSSHTLLSYPIFQRARVIDNRSVAVALGGTVITDTAALLLLVAIARFEQGDLTWHYAVTTGPLLVAAGVAIMWGLPRVGAWFFTSIGQERSARFLFVMVSLFAAATLAEQAGVEPIIGAFLAGLALNRLVVHGSTLSTQIGFFGTNFFTPMFMISVGMLVDPALLVSSGETLRRAAGFTVAVVAGKAVAAYVSGKAFGWRRAEIAALFSLSVAQAAATLAAVFVGFDIGLLDESTVNAVIIVILVTCVMSTFVGGVVVTRLPPPAARVERLGRRVLLPVSGGSPIAQQVRIAAALAASDAGTVLPLTVLGYATSPLVLRHRRGELVDTVERQILGYGAEARSEVRLDSSRAAGILHAAVEQDATCIVVGWKGWSTRRESFFGEAIDALLSGAAMPVLVVRHANVEAPNTSIVLALDDNDHRLDHQPAVAIALATSMRLAAGLKVPLLVCRASGDSPWGPDEQQGEIVTGTGDLAAVLRESTRRGDLIVKALPATHAGLGNRFVRQIHGLDDRTIIATSPARADAATVQSRPNNT